MKKCFPLVVVALLGLVLVSCTEKEDDPQNNYSFDSAEPHFDEGVELMWLIWKLADFSYNDFNHYCIRSINESADAYFAKMMDHHAVSLAKSIAKEYGVGEDAVAAFGLHLFISKKGEISFNPAFADSGESSFDRWPEQEKQRMLAAVNDFYQQSNFHEWYQSLEPMRQQAISLFKKVNNVDYGWFSSFFGSAFDDMPTQIVLSFLTAGHNYGCSVIMKNGKELLSPVINIYQMSSTNVNGYSSTSTPSVLIHEFCHPFCNPLIDKYWSSMEDKANMVFNRVADQMKSQAYTYPSIMMYETLVRSCTIRYLMSHLSLSEQEKEKEKYKNMCILSDESNGFMMVRTLVDVLEKREQQQAQYATLDDFMPEIIEAVNAFEPVDYNGKHDQYTYPSTPNLLPGVFSVSPTQKVQFTKSNLYWNGKEWRFEANQMNYPVDWDPNHVSHFYWTTTAAFAYAKTYVGPGNTVNDRLFCDGSDDAHCLTVEGVSGLRVLSDTENGEIEYLLHQRTNAQNLFRFPVEIKGVGDCLIIAPDNYSGSIDISYDETSWATAEAAGLVCLAPDGLRKGASIERKTGNDGYYWCGNPCDQDGAFMLCFTAGMIYHYPYYSPRNCGLSIRLVKDVAE